jgi:hypothetical protein
MGRTLPTRLPHPLKAFRESGYLERVVRERSERNAVGVTSYA